MTKAKAYDTPKPKQPQVDHNAKIAAMLQNCTTKASKQGEEMAHKCKELKRKLDSAEESDVIEQGKTAIKAVKKELRALQKAEEEQNQGEHNVALMVEKLNEAHDEALSEIEERERHFAALYGNDGDDEMILSSDQL